MTTIIQNKANTIDDLEMLTWMYIGAQMCNQKDIKWKAR